MTYGQYPAPLFTLAHISDTHLRTDGPLYDTIDTAAGLRLALDRVGRLTPTPDAVIFTGDLADLGEPAAYAELREEVAPIAAEWGAQIIWGMGNHDERTAYAQALFGAADEAPQDRVYDVRGLRIIALDSSVPGYHHGELTDDQLSWLAAELATPAEHGTVLALHHPPIPLPLMPGAELIELLDQDRLAAVVAGSDVRQILAGHLHYATYSTFAGIPVSVASATCYTCDPAPRDLFLAGVAGDQAITMVHVYADRVVHTLVPLAEQPVVTSYPAQASELLAGLTPAERLDLVSRKDSPLYTGEIQL